MNYQPVLSGRYVLFNIYPLSYKDSFIELTNKKLNQKILFGIYVNGVRLTSKQNTIIYRCK